MESIHIIIKIEKFSQEKTTRSLIIEIGGVIIYVNGWIKLKGFLTIPQRKK